MKIEKLKCKKKLNISQLYFYQLQMLVLLQRCIYLTFTSNFFRYQKFSVSYFQIVENFPPINLAVSLQSISFLNSTKHYL